MTTIAGLVDHFGNGLLHKRQLVRHGARDHHLTAAVRNGEVRRPRRGWYTTWHPDDPRFVAVRVGGRLSGMSALVLMGAWAVSRHPPITVSVPANAARLRWRRRARIVWDGADVTGRGSTWAVDPRDALREAVTEVPFEEAVALLDWAMHSRLLDENDLAHLVQGLPADVRPIVEWADPRCESFLESIARTRLRAAGHTTVSQHPLPGDRRVDFVVDGVVGLEVDGREHHESTFESDRRKDLQIVVDGSIPLRISYSMVMDEWAAVESAIRTAVSMHRRGAPVPFGNSGFPRRPRAGDRRAWRLPRAGRHARPELPEGWPRGRAERRRRPRPLVRHRYDR
jgi:very-short-patch-repair endonuclease